MAKPSPTPIPSPNNAKQTNVAQDEVIREVGEKTDRIAGLLTEMDVSRRKFEASGKIVQDEVNPVVMFIFRVRRAHSVFNKRLKTMLGETHPIPSDDIQELILLSDTVISTIDKEITSINLLKDREAQGYLQGLSSSIRQYIQDIKAALRNKPVEQVGK